MIDYKWVTEDTRTEFEAVLRKHGLRFLRWRAGSVRRKTLPIATVFKQWWLQRGPLGFRTNEDAFRFQSDLLAFVEKTMLPDMRSMSPVTEPTEIVGFRLPEVAVDETTRPLND
jgi:hypothetical protein